MQKVLGLPSADGRPVATLGLIAACVVLFFLSGAMLGSGNQLFSLLALNAFPVAGGELFRLVSYGFLHASLIHIGFNMLLLWLLGSQLEMEFGSRRFLAVYFVSLVFGAFGALLLSPFALTVGASGAVYGLMGAFVVLMLARGVNPFKTGLGALLLLNLALSFVLPGVSLGGHLGGLFGGALAAFALVLSQRRRAAWIFYVAAALLFAAGVGLSLWVSLLAV